MTIHPNVIAIYSATAKLRRIVVGGSLVLENRRKVRVPRLPGISKSRVHSQAGTTVEVLRFGVMHLCGVGRRTKGEQQAQDKDKAHRKCSNRPAPFLIWCIGRVAAMRRIVDSHDAH